MPSKVETLTPPNTPTPIGPYNHIAKVGPFITIGGTAGVDPATNRLSGPDVQTQTRQILESFKIMLESVAMGRHRPARTVIGVHELPKPGVLLTMNLTAISKEWCDTVVLGCG
jgi:2-iminobutanoate/2-iminopropanoate deaminase